MIPRGRLPILNFERATLLENRNVVTFPLFHGKIGDKLLDITGDRPERILLAQR